MYWRDHPPPHFHATYAGQVAEIGIDSLEVLDGWLPPRALRLVVEWAEMHKDELRANWARARAHDVSPQSTRCPSIPLVVAVTAVAPLDGYRLQLRFDDGSERVVDLSEALWGPMAEPLRDPDYFRLVRVDPELRTVAWPNGFDLDPDVLHGDYEPDSAPSPAVPEPRGA